ncbi:PstS family phosphate ABC transporter substrate-binding protein [Peterkaempfera sp. SMS 1(5)a]|uniref:PstS family phosphate ABC transporter substrate-binding protein n=1 Tax=Peterkaempfera podocarpi TaxID=3232308 RepID=UPI00366C34D9
MRMVKKSLLLAATAASLAVVMPGTALASEPTPPVSDSSIVFAGSDTTEYVIDAIATAYNAQSPAPARNAYSYLAEGTATLQTKTSASATLARPVGSGAGISALLDVNNTNTLNASGTRTHVDVARSSSDPSAGPSSLLFVPFAVDAVTWAAKSGGNAPANLTTQQLHDIYSCTVTNWSAVGGTSGTIAPVLPQANSGTRKMFLSKIGVTTPGTCVTSNDSIVENEGTNAVFTGANAANVLVPYATSKFIAQENQLPNAAADLRGSLTLRQVNSVAPRNADGTLNSGFPYKREVYNVVIGSTIPAYLQGLLSDTGYLCNDGQSIVEQYGFAPLVPGDDDDCGFGIPGTGV